MAASSPAIAQLTDYTQLDLEELSFVRISTLGRKQTPLFEMPAAATVITGDELMRSGALHFGEALRSVPGLQVARIDALDFAISSRGFNDTTSNKLLVSMDGRSVYSTTFSGAEWTFHELVLEDVERIEVLRGPGASLWGANAMNGVINVVTKDARDTVGGLLSVAVGSELEASVSARQGWKLGSSGSMRIYGRYQEHDDYGIERGTATGGWDSRLVGSRYDWHGRNGGHLTLIGEYRGQRAPSETVFPLNVPPYAVVLPELRRAHGSNLSARWAQPVWQDADLSVLVTYDHLHSEQLQYVEERDTFNVDLQMTLRGIRRHEIIIGGTFRTDDGEMTDSPWLRYTVPSDRTTFTGAFIQDDIVLIPQRLNLSLGTKIERNSFSGWETQPSVRAIWTPHPGHRIWAGISRAARTPTRSEQTVDLFAAVVPPGPASPLPIELHALGSDAFGSEHLTAFELGHRFQPNLRFSVDLALYYNQYEDLRGLRPHSIVPQFQPPPHVDLNLTVANNLEGSTRGGEISARWMPATAWTVEAAWAVIDYDLTEIQPFLGQIPGFPANADPTIAGLEGSTPEHEGKLRLAWSPNTRWSADLALRHTAALEGIGLPAYTGLDARVGWRWTPNLEIELIGRDLLTPSHAEFSTFFLVGTTSEFNRSFFLRATLRY